MVILMWNKSLSVFTSSGDWLLLGWADVISVDFVVVAEETIEEFAANGVDMAECVLASSMGGVATAADAPAAGTSFTVDSADGSDVEANPSCNAAGASSTVASASDGDAVMLEF